MAGKRRSRTSRKRTNRPAKKATPSTASPGRPHRPTREERIEAHRRARRRREQRTRVILVVAAIAIVVAIVVVVVNNRRQNQRLISALEAGSCSFDRDVDSGRDHVVGAVSYRVDPPAGGDHLASPSPAGTYEGAHVPDDANLVHSLEHGFVIVWHERALPQRDRQAIAEATRRYERDVLIVERPSLTVPVAATAWHKRLLCTEVEGDTLARFVGEFRNDGPEKVPHP